MGEIQEEKITFAFPRKGVRRQRPEFAPALYYLVIRGLNFQFGEAGSLVICLVVGGPELRIQFTGPSGAVIGEEGAWRWGGV